MIKAYTLPVIVIAQFLCTSLWFAGNAVMPGLTAAAGLHASQLGWVTSSVQIGFIAGTIVYAIFMFADRYPAARVFLLSALGGAIFNAFLGTADSFALVVSYRFATGFFLAGIYPVGMKIASDYYLEGLGRSLGYLVGALVLGTALPHLLATLDLGFSWQMVIYCTSVLAAVGGMAIFILVPEGPFRSKGQQVNFTSSMQAFRHPRFRAASFGYFGHMWELYAFWAFLPVILEHYKSYRVVEFATPAWAFVIIGVGSLSCVWGGYLSQRFGEAKIATLALGLSGSCCLLSPLMFWMPLPIFLVFLIIWGMAVIADSPLFSSLVAKNALPELKGTALTVVTCIGFSITVLSIQGIALLVDLSLIHQSLMLLAIGPIFGVWSLRKLTFASS